MQDMSIRARSRCVVVEETTEVLSPDLQDFFVAVRRTGGKVRRSAPITIGGKLGYAVTAIYRVQR